jgi:uncharacterized protein YqgQ
LQIQKVLKKFAITCKVANSRKDAIMAKNIRSMRMSHYIHNEENDEAIVIISKQRIEAGDEALILQSFNFYISKTLSLSVISTYKRGDLFSPSASPKFSFSFLCLTLLL